MQANWWAHHYHQHYPLLGGCKESAPQIRLLYVSSHDYDRMFGRTKDLHQHILWRRITIREYRLDRWSDKVYSSSTCRIAPGSAVRINWIWSRTAEVLIKDDTHFHNTQRIIKLRPNFCLPAQILPSGTSLRQLYASLLPISPRTPSQRDLSSSFIYVTQQFFLEKSLVGDLRASVLVWDLNPSPSRTPPKWFWIFGSWKSSFWNYKWCGCGVDLDKKLTLNKTRALIFYERIGDSPRNLWRGESASVEHESAIVTQASENAQLAELKCLTKLKILVSLLAGERNVSYAWSMFCDDK